MSPVEIQPTSADQGVSFTNGPIGREGKWLSALPSDRLSGWLLWRIGPNAPEILCEREGDRIMVVYQSFTPEPGDGLESPVRLVQCGGLSAWQNTRTATATILGGEFWHGPSPTPGREETRFGSLTLVLE